jgi:predicted membrane chloride channel (bestrophin family)
VLLVLTSRIHLGHALLAIVVSFLVVTRVNLALAQYKEARGNLSKMLTSTRDIVSATVSRKGSVS